MSIIRVDFGPGAVEPPCDTEPQCDYTPAIRAEADLQAMHVAIDHAMESAGLKRVSRDLKQTISLIEYAERIGDE